ncbi:putative ATPase/GAF domain-containing protein [Paenibacillus mucilaginosus]|uniref:AAA family ATPase n=1 Tax=Paenibacillus mucilaginosus TaxID=61624 RepID=UPI003D214C5E
MALQLNEGAAERLDDTAAATWFRTEDSGGRRRLVKALKAEYGTPGEVQRLRLELEKGRRLGFPEVLLPLGIVTFRGTPALVTEAAEGVLLSSVLSPVPAAPEVFLPLALSMTDAVRQLHKHKFAHTALSPQAFFIDKDAAGGRVRLTELHSLVSLGSPHDPAAPAESAVPPQPERNPFLAPEQMHDPTAGRVNVHPDHRTDLYALGVLFYRLLTGLFPSLPDIGSDGSAPSPVPPAELAVSVPEVLSAVVMKLLARQPDQRYPSAFALHRDLAKCLEQWSAAGTIEAFALGTVAGSDHFAISETIYGRETELQQLHAAYGRCLSGSLQTAFVSGLSGIGKSYLIHEFQKGLTPGSALYVHGKFDQYKRESPYYAIRQIGRQLMQHLLQQPPEELQLLKERIRDAVGPNGQILLEMNPDLEAVIGKQPPLTKLPPAEMHNRFILTIRQYTSVFASQEHPLVLFLDDLQWADPASLQLVSEFLLEMPFPYLLFIGAYREREVTDSHPLRSLIGKLGRSRTAPVEIRLEPLQEPHVARLLEDTLQPSKQDPRELAGLIMSKTKGNPFFTKQFFRSLYDQHLLRFDDRSCCWAWDTDRIKELHITDNVVDFMISKIRRLSESMQHLLMHAACLGQQFTPEVLSLVTGYDGDRTALLLKQAVDDSLLLRVVGGRRTSSAEAVTSYKFMHDRVYQAVYSLLPDSDKKRIHLHIGRLLQAYYAEEEHDLTVFEVTDQLNLGSDGITSPPEREDLAELNLRAARKAKGNSAFDTAYRYASQGVQLLGEEAWSSRFELAYALRLEMAELEYLCGHFGEAKASFETVLRLSRTKLEKADVYNLMIILHTHIGEHEQAVRLGLEGLKLFGLSLRPKIGKGSILWEMFKSRIHLGLRSQDDLLDHYPMSEPEHEAVMRFLVNLIPSAYFLDADLYVYLMLRMFNYSLMHGHSDGSAYAYSTYGVILSAVFGRLKAGWEYGRLSVQLSDIYPNPAIKSKVYFAYGGFSNNIREHIEANVGHLRKAYQYGVESGDLVYAGYSIAFSFFMQVLKGDTLPEILQESEKYRQFVHQAQDRDVIWIYTVIQRYILSLKETAGAPNAPQEPLLSPEEAQIVRGLSNKAVVHTFYGLQAQSFYLLNHLEEARLICEETEANLGQMFGFPHIELHHFQYGMVLASLYDHAGNALQMKYRKRIRKSLKILGKWAAHSPSNYLHMNLLLQAEYDRITDKRMQAAEKFDLAIQAAARSGFLPREALANERAALFYLRTGRIKIAKAYLLDARSLYERWGAARKVAQLEALYPGLLGWASSADVLPAACGVLKATPPVTYQTVFHHMLDCMMSQMLEYARADKALLMLEQDGQLQIEAEKSLKDPFRSLHSTPVEEGVPAAVTAVDYVKQSGEPLLLKEAPDAGLFGNDPYIREIRPQSLLCLPLTSRGEAAGILYLESRTAAHAFQPDRFGRLKLLAAAAAELVRRARLTASLEVKEDLLPQAHELGRQQSRPQPVVPESRRGTARDGMPSSRQLAQTQFIRRLQGVHALLALNKTETAQESIAVWCEELVQMTLADSVAFPALRSALLSLLPAITAAGIELQVDGRLDCLFERLSLPPSLFAGTLQPLLQHALDAAAARESQRVVRLTLTESESHYGLAVLYSGSPVGEEPRHRPFEKAPPLRTDDSPVVPLVQSLQHMLQPYGGELQCRYEAGRGMIFTLRLPKQAAGDRVPREAAASGLDH